jgi:hypothetical protein
MLKGSPPYYRLSVILIFLSSMVVSLNFLDPINWPKQILIVVAAGYVFLQSLYVASINKDQYIVRVVFLILGSAMFYAIPALFVNVDLSRFLWGVFGRNNGFVTNISLILICAASFLFARNGASLIDFLRISTFLTFISGVYGYVQLFRFDFVDWSKQNEVFSLFGNANFASAAFAVGTISSLLLCLDSLKEGRIFESWISGASFTILAGITYFTKSIQGVLGILIAIVLVSIILVFRRSRVLGWAIMSLAIPAVLLILMGFYGEGPLGSRIYQYTLALRLEYWVAGLKMGLDNLLFGVGYESYGDFFQRYRSDEVTQMTGVGLTTNNAHNPFIQIFATLGILGSIPLVTLFVSTLIQSARNFLSKELSGKSLSNKKIASVLFLSSWSMAFFSIDNIAIATLNWFIMGMALGVNFTNSNRELQSGTSNRKLKLNQGKSMKGWTEYRKEFSLVVTLTLLAFSWTSAAPNRDLAEIFNNNQINESDPNWLNTRQNALLKVVENPMSRETELKWAAEAFYNLGLEDATIKTLVIGARRFPSDMNLLDNLAFVYERKADFESAIEVRRLQLDIEKRNWRIYYFLALDLQKLGKSQESKQELRNIVDLKKFMSKEEIEQFQEIERNFGE